MLEVGAPMTTLTLLLSKFAVIVAAYAALAISLVIEIGKRPAVFAVVWLALLAAVWCYAQRFVVIAPRDQRMGESTRRRLALDRGEDIETTDAARAAAISRVEVRY